jgi:hypothetical protein
VGGIRDAPPARAVEALYRLPLDRFTAERNRLATDLGGEAGSRIRALPRPGLPAWTVNQLHASHRREFSRLLRAGERLRRVQARGGGLAALRAAAAARRAAIDRLMDRADGILESGGHARSRSTLRRIAATLEAIAAGVAPEKGLGQLHEDLQPPGFAALRGLRRRPPARTGDRRAAQQARRLAGTAERRLAGAMRRSNEADAAVKSAEARVREAAAALEAARDRLEEAERRGRRAAADLDRARARAEDAATARRRSAADLEQARRALHRDG